MVLKILTELFDMVIWAPRTNGQTNHSTFWLFFNANKCVHAQPIVVPYSPVSFTHSQASGQDAQNAVGEELRLTDAHCT